MPVATETYFYRVQHWYIPIHSPWLPQTWTLSKSNLTSRWPSAGRGVPADNGVVRGNRETWCWDDGNGTPRKVVAIELKSPITKTFEYHDVL